MELHAQNIMIILGSIVNMIGDTYIKVCHWLRYVLLMACAPHLSILVMILLWRGFFSLRWDVRGYLNCVQCLEVFVAVVVGDYRVRVVMGEGIVIGLVVVRL